MTPPIPRRMLLQTLGAASAATAVSSNVASAAAPGSVKLRFDFNRPNDSIEAFTRIRGDVSGKRVLLVEDLITTAGSILKFVGALRSAGATVSDVSVVFTRAGESARNALAEAGLRLHALCELDTLLAVAKREGVATEAALAEVRGFLADPEGWSQKRDAAA